MVAGLCFQTYFANHTEASVKVDRAKLIQTAIDYQSHSYAPYSHYNVSVAVLMSTGKADQIAYVRFVSVYKPFSDTKSFMAELERLMYDE